MASPTARGYPTVAWFDWGADTNYGYVTTLTNVGASSQVARVSAVIEGLTAGAIYHCRLVASNALGTAFGPDSVLTTGMKGSTSVDPSGSYGDYPAIPPG